MGGVSVLLETILSKIDKKKFQIDVLILHNNGEMLKNLDSNINVIHGTPYFGAVDYPISDIVKKKNILLLIRKLRVVFGMKTGLIKRKIKKERKKILKNHYDVEVAFKDGFTALFTAYGDSKKKIHWLHYEYEKTNPNGKYPKLFMDALPRFDKIVAVSKRVMDCFNKIYHQDDKTIVINNIVDSEKIREKSNEIILEKNDSKKINFISVGRLSKEKGYDRLIEAISRLKNRLSNCCFKIYGSGNELENLEALVKSYKLENIVLFKGQTFNPYPFIKDSDVFILSSFYEAFGLVIIESMSLGVPVIATANSATSELIKNDFNGLVVDNSVDWLYTGIKEIIEHPEKIEMMKKNLIRYSYPTLEIINKIENLLEE